MKMLIPAAAAIVLAFGLMLPTAKAAAKADATVNLQAAPAEKGNPNGGNSGDAHENNGSSKDDDVTAGKGKDKPPKSKKDKD